jgi:hypothetical protein
MRYGLIAAAQAPFVSSKSTSSASRQSGSIYLFTM